MRRIRLSTGPLAIFGGVFVFALILFLPMRLALGWIGLGEAGLTARQASGSIWLGTLREARFGDLDLGSLHAGLSPWRLALGEARVSLSGPPGGTARRLEGAVSISRHAFGIEDMNALVPTGAVFAPVPVSALDLDSVTVRFKDGSCLQAEGRVRATIADDPGGIGLPPTLSGTARCEGGALVLPLVGGGGTESVALRLWSTGRFRAELLVKPADSVAAGKLALSGFQPTPQGYALSIEGRF